MTNPETYFPFDNNLFTKTGELAGPRIEEKLEETGLWVVIGPSGAGKSTEIAQYLKKHPRKTRTIRFAAAMAKTEIQKIRGRGFWNEEDWSDMGHNLTSNLTQAINEEDPDTLIVLEDMCIKATDNFDRGWSTVKWVSDHKEELTEKGKKPFVTCTVGDPANLLEAGEERAAVIAIDGNGEFLIPDKDVTTHLYGRYRLNLLGLPQDPVIAGRIARKYFLTYVAETSRMFANNALLDEAARVWISENPTHPENPYRITEWMWMPPIIGTRRMGPDLPSLTNSAIPLAMTYRTRSEYLEHFMLREFLNLSEEEGMLIHNPYQTHKEIVIDLSTLMSKSEMDLAA